MKQLYILLGLLFTAGFMTAQVNVRFSVDMNDVSGFDPAGGVFVAGNFQDPQWAPGNGALSDDDGNGVWTGVFPVTAASIEFKFGQGNDWGNNEFGDGIEPGGGCAVIDGGGNVNRSEAIDATVTALPVYKYNTCDVSALAVSTKNLSTLSGVKVSPNPMTNVAILTIANPSAAHNITISNVAGQVIRTMSNVTGNTVEIERGDMVPGLYFVTFHNNRGEAGSVRLSVQ